jgi:ribosomal protein S18 acetylase RimI-like enzyme
MFSADFVLDVLDCVPDAIVDGGWAVDAVIGRVTRVHDDLDLVLPAARVESAVAALMPLGFTERIDEPPARVVLATPYDQRVDIHIVTPTERGMVQLIAGGGQFTYALHGEGTILGRTVRCLSPGTQVITHSMYEPDAHDVADMRALAEATGEALGPPYVRPTGREPLRDATAADAAAFCAVRHRAWQEAYAGLMPARVLTEMDIGAAYAGWWPFLRLRPSRRHSAIVAGKTGTVVGLAVSGPTRDEDLDRSINGELNLLYVDPTAKGLGLGKRLLVAAMDRLRENGFEDLRLWVLQANAHARSFYERNGWWTDGATRVENYPGGEVVEVRYQAEPR